MVRIHIRLGLLARVQSNRHERNRQLDHPGDIRFPDHVGRWKTLEDWTITLLGAVAQLEERHNGIVEVVGSIPSGSTNLWGLVFEWNLTSVTSPLYLL